MNREQKGKICFVSSIICDVKGEFIRTLENIEQKIKIHSNWINSLWLLFNLFSFTNLPALQILPTGLLTN